MGCHRTKEDQSLKIILIIAATVLLIPINSYTWATSLVPTSKVSNPETAAKRFYGAWKRTDRPAARRVASRSAVSQLFKTRFTKGSPGWQFQGCERLGRGYDCYYSYEGGSATMRVTGNASAGYLVSSIKFTAD
jgi:hypothetical protein